MTDPEPTLLLTRPEPQSRSFLELCEARAGRSLSAVISPVLRIEATGALPDLDRFDVVIVTSANAVRCLAGGAGLTGRRMVTVGARTAEAARAAGADATMLGEDADSFVAAAAQIGGRAILCRGVHAQGDIAARLASQGVMVEESIVYDQVAQSLSLEAEALLAGRLPVLIPLFSPRSADVLGRQAKIDAPVTVIAMSENVAARWPGPGRVAVADAPTAEAMCDKVIAQF